MFISWSERGYPVTTRSKSMEYLNFLVGGSTSSSSDNISIASLATILLCGSMVLTLESLALTGCYCLGCCSFTCLLLFGTDESGGQLGHTGSMMGVSMPVTTDTDLPAVLQHDFRKRSALSHSFWVEDLKNKMQGISTPP